MCELAQKPTTVSIQPIIAHLPTGEDLAEVGVGGGGDDLQRETELEYLDQASLAALFNMFVEYTNVAEAELIMSQDPLLLDIFDRYVRYAPRTPGTSCLNRSKYTIELGC